MPMAPGESAFTTLPWDGGERVAFGRLYLQRLREHADRLEIAWPSSPTLPPLSPGTRHPDRSVCPPGLARLSLRADGRLHVELRRHTMPSKRSLRAVTRPAPRWAPRVTGTKHADWPPYAEAHASAKHAGADVALLVVEDAVVDGDRCTPLLLDDAGTIFHPAGEDGAVESITLKVLTPCLNKAGIPVRPARLTRALLSRAEALLVVGSGVGVAGIEAVDDMAIRNVSCGPLTQLLTTALIEARRDAWGPYAALAALF